MAGDKAAPTERVVLRRLIGTEPSVDHPPGTLGLDGTVEAWVPVRNEKAEHGPDGEVRIFKTASKTEAIRQYTGRGPDARPGVYRAPSLRSWKGGLEITVPERPVPEEKLFDV